MKILSLGSLLLLPCVASISGHADPLTWPICSTEKVNGNCIIEIDRRFPVAMPTFQMRPNTHIMVVVIHPYHFETLTLDPQTLQALPGLDQGASLVTSAIPDLKGLTASATNSFYSQRFSLALPEIKANALQMEKDLEAKIEQELTALQNALTTAQNAVPTMQGLLKTYVSRASIIYAQLEEIESSVPRPVASSDPGSGPTRNPRVPSETYDPWKDYSHWRNQLLCEFNGRDTVCSQIEPARVLFSNIMSETDDLIAKLPSTSSNGKPVPPADNSVFDLSAFDSGDPSSTFSQVSDDISNVTDSTTQKALQGQLNKLVKQETGFLKRLSQFSANITKVQTDLQTYEANIGIWKGESDQTSIETASNREFIKLGFIADPRSNNHNAAPYKLLGRQISYAVNAENQIATPVLSVPTSTQKTAVVTVTALYADPIFETSAGAIFSFLHDRSYTNQTVVVPPPGSTLAAGDMYIDETKTQPEVIPIVAANWRLGHDFVMPVDGRRAAFYGTIWLGLNPYNTLPEFGAGPTFSWRSFMISPLYHRGHDIRLTQNEYVNQVWCNVNATAGSTPGPCTPAPPSPSTQTFWTNAFGIGISIRVPTTYTAGTGGVSH